MNSQRRKQINLLAENIRGACEISSPVDMQTVISRLGGRLNRVMNLEYEAKVEKIEDGFEITLPEGTAHKINRERFTIAHELGHLFLHMGFLIDNARWEAISEYRDSVYYRYGHSLEEKEANEFAAAFLMPKGEFIEVAQKHLELDGYNVEPLAKYFNVSVEAAINRGRGLGLFTWE